MMERQMRHLVRLVDDLLDVSRITRGKMQLRRELLRLNEVLSGALESSQTLFEPHGHRLTVTLPPEPLCVLGDPDRLRQVFSNLFSNAAKFTPREGTIWVTLERDGGRAKVRVRDTGVGIPPERLGQVFEMFAQVNTLKGNDGLGIGLALARQLVALQGGTIEAHSEGAGEGSEFTVCLPLVPMECVEGVEPAGNGAACATVQRKILIVDDNVDGAASLAEMLRMRGHAVQTVNGGEDAVRATAQATPEVILMDLGMPGMDGLTAARLIRQQPRGSQIRIIALTGWGQESDREKTRAAGIGEHLVKPVNPEALFERLESDAPAR
jgi:CheY-like chemotaxis protein